MQGAGKKPRDNIGNSIKRKDILCKCQTEKVLFFSPALNDRARESEYNGEQNAILFFSVDFGMQLVHRTIGFHFWIQSFTLNRSTTEFQNPLEKEVSRPFCPSPKKLKTFIQCKKRNSRFSIQNKTHTLYNLARWLHNKIMIPVNRRLRGIT